MSTRSLYIALGALGIFYLQVRGWRIMAGFFGFDGPSVVLGSHLLALVIATRFVVLVGR